MADNFNAIATSPRNGKLVAAQIVGDDDEIMLITTGGVLIRTKVMQIREMGRSTQGVRLLRLEDDDSVAAAAVLQEENEEEKK